MKLNKIKTNYIVFDRAQQSFATRLTLNGKYIKRQRRLGVWLEEDGTWKKNTNEQCRNAYARLSFLTKLKYAVASIEDLIHTYKMFIRSRLEYCTAAFHSALTKQQEASLERCQAVCLRIILQLGFRDVWIENIIF